MTSLDETFLLACTQNDSNTLKSIDTTQVKTDTVIDGFSIVLKNKNKDLIMFFMMVSEDKLRFCLIAFEIMTNPVMKLIFDRNSDLLAT